MKKQYFSYVFLILMLIPSFVFATDYSNDYMAGRQTETIGNETYVSQGEPVQAKTTYRGVESTENFIGNDGNPYPAGTVLISYDEKGNTGNTREQSDICFNDPTMGSASENKVVIDVLAEPVVPVKVTDDNGNTVVQGYNLPYAEVGQYTGDIYTSQQDFINHKNADGYFKFRFEDRVANWTIETFNEYFGEDAVGKKSIFYNESFESTVRKPIYKNGQLIYEGYEGAAITAIMGFGATQDGRIFAMSNSRKLYNIIGNPSTLPEIRELYIGGPSPAPIPTGTWSDYGAASVSANVWSDIYNVSDAIPTSEYVHGSISASDMSWSYVVEAKADSESFRINGVTLLWDPYEVKVFIWDKNESGEWYETDEFYWETRYRYSEVADIEGIFTTHYFHVANAEMNVLAGGSVSNGAVGGIASLGAESIGGSINRNGGIQFDTSRMNKNSFTATGDTKSIAIANAQATIAGRIQAASYVTNDTLTIKSSVLGGKTEYGEIFKSTPYDSPSFLNSPGISTKSNSGKKKIQSTVENGEYASSASAKYEQVGGFDGKATYNKGAGAPRVFVHTPVVAQMDNSSIVTYPFINQKVVQDSTKKYLILDDGFELHIPTTGSHIGSKGYGTRGYNSNQAVDKLLTNWGKIKDVKLSFDVYVGSTLVPAGTWLSDLNLAGAGSVYVFVVPVWAEEGPGTITVRVVAENANSYINGSSYDSSLVAESANLNPDQYVAETTLNVEVIGKIYDLRISGTNDPAWENINGQNGPYVTSKEFPFGQANQNKMTQYKFAPKLGYVVEFDFKTKGIKTDNVDVSVQPEGFYFVGKNGGTAQEVDLYFQTTNKQYVKIALSNTTSNILVNLSNKFMKVAISELIDSKLIMGTLIGLPYTYNENVNIGKLPKLQIPEKLRLCYNNFAEYVNRLYGKSKEAIIVDATDGLDYSVGKYDRVTNGEDVVKASVGHWYAGYRLPSSTIAVPKGTSASELARNPNLAKKNGYILVKFDIVGKNGTEEYLRYTGPEALNGAGFSTGTYEKDPNNEPKQWQDPDGTAPDGTNPNQPVTLPNGKPATVPDGTVLIFETDLRANNDYEVIGTH